jgi:hypothetical protein
VFCNYCRAPNPDDSLFCRACGKSIAATTPTPVRIGSRSVAPSSEDGVSIPDSAVPQGEGAAYSAAYKGMSDDELIRLQNEAGSLRDGARVELVAELLARNLQEAPARAAIPEPGTVGNELRGVGGWLAWFVFGLLVGGPASFAIGISNAYNVTKTPGMNSDSATLYFAIDAVLSVGLAVWSVCCGIYLLKLKPNAVRITKAYLVALFLFCALGLMVTAAGAARNDPSSNGAGASVVPFFQEFTGIIIWYSYFERSKRVRNTYPNTSR